MTHSPITCEQFNDGLTDLLEQDVTLTALTARAQLEQHALSCAECGPLLADLRKLLVEAASLTELAPARDLWQGIEQRIGAEIAPLGRASDIVSHSARNRRSLWLGLAAAGLVVVTATITHEITKRSAKTPPSSTVATSSGAPATFASNGAAATERAYAPQIAELHRMLAERRPQLDSTTVAVVERNLKIIDDAIAQCKAALRNDPASQFLIESLNEAFDDKVRLLQTAVRLPVRT